MDELYQQVSQRVEAAQRSGEAPAQTFVAVRELALEAAGRSAPVAVDARLPATLRYGEGLGQRPSHPRRPLPHLTESWFC